MHSLDVSPLCEDCNPQEIIEREIVREIERAVASGIGAGRVALFGYCSGRTRSPEDTLPSCNLVCSAEVFIGEQLHKAAIDLRPLKGTGIPPSEESISRAR